MSGGSSGQRAVFEAARGFPLDPFQLEALEALDGGQSVLVAAPTGSGKTVVAEYAVDLALAGSAKVFYTTPLKALSNQKFGDFTRAHGAGRVGLLTGDNAINGDAPVVVMTTEVLRNMIYAGSPTLAGLRYVILDEVHYLQNPYRGPVWEEVIIHLAAEVDLVCLSATVSNAEEFAEWIQTVRGETRAVIEERRPVELEHLYLVGERGNDELHLLPTFVTGEHGELRPNPEPARLDASPARRGRGRPRASQRLRTPSRVETVDRLAEEDMLPAIEFVFSRAGCDQAVEQCLAAGLRLTEPADRAEIARIADEHTAGLAPEDLDVLGHHAWRAGLEAGFAAHHAGMVPPMKEAVEEAFAAGLVRMVFATETLSLGINMPARTVVIEKLSKWDGERHELLTPGEYTQLTGRAGRRGIDTRGAAVVLHQPFIPFERITALAATRTYPLLSSFRPSYNMAVNLVANYTRAEAERLLASSFAQFLSDRTVHGAEQAIARNSRYLDGYLRSAACDRGDVLEYWELRRQIRARESALADADRRSRDEEAVALVRGLTPGTVVHLPGWASGGRRRGLAAVLGSAGGRGGLSGVLVLTEDRRVRRVSVRDLGDAPVLVGRIALPRPFSPKSPRFKARVAEALAELDVEPPPRPRRRRARAAGDAELAELRARLRAHPVHTCSELQEHERWMQRWDQLQRETERLGDRVRRRTGSLVRTFDRVLAVLERLGYQHGFSLTAKGETLRRVYSDADLLVVEAIHREVWRDLDPAELAACVSSLVYEARGGPEGPPGEEAAPPTARVRAALDRLAELQDEIHSHEEAEGLELTRPLDPGFADLAHRWARGDSLDEVLAYEEITPGDFVRVTKQLIDLLRQIAQVAEDPALADTARAAVDGCQRGVVAYSGMV